MGLAVTHVIITIIILDLFRHYVFGKRKFPRYLLVVGGIAGLIPDIDIPIGFLITLFTSVQTNLHRVFTHSFIFPILILIIAIILHFKENHKWAKIGFVIAAGWSLHIIFDCFYGGYLPFTWPFNLITSCPSWGLAEYGASIDAIILVLWLVHEEIHNKIKDYI